MRQEERKPVRGRLMSILPLWAIEALFCWYHAVNCDSPEAVGRLGCLLTINAESIKSLAF